MKRVHFAAADFQSEIVAAPLLQYGCDRLYVVSLISPEAGTPFAKSLDAIYREGSIVSPIEQVVELRCDPHLESIFHTVDKAVAVEVEAGNKVYMNISAGSRLFTAAAAIISNRREVELYYVQNSTYYVERQFSRGIEKVIALPRVQPRAAEIAVDSSLCFVLMPFSGKVQNTYDDVIKPVVQRAGLRCVRADDFFDNRPIMDDIWSSIKKARLVLADLTDRNPNVFYETGLAHAIGKEVVLLTQELADVPFDLKHLRCLVYTDTLRGAKALGEALEKTIATVIARTSKAHLAQEN